MLTPEERERRKYARQMRRLARKATVVSVDTTGECPIVCVQLDNQTEDCIPVTVEDGPTPEVGDEIDIEQIDDDSWSTKGGKNAGKDTGMTGGAHAVLLYTIPDVTNDDPLTLEIPGLAAGTITGWKITGSGKAADFDLKIDGNTEDSQTGDGAWEACDVAAGRDAQLRIVVTNDNSQTGAALVYIRISN